MMDIEEEYMNDNSNTFVILLVLGVFAVLLFYYFMNKENTSIQSLLPPIQKSLPDYTPTIFVFRNSEETEEELNDSGKKRSSDLVENKKLYSKIDVIYCSKQKKTLMSSLPLAFAEQAPIFNHYKPEETKKLVNYIMNHPLRPKNIAIFYDNKYIQQLMSDFGHSVPYWEDDNYSRIYVIKDSKLTLDCQDKNPICQRELVFKKQI